MLRLYTYDDTPICLHIFNFLRDIGAPFSLSLKSLNIVASGEGGGLQNPTKDNSAPLSVIKIVKHCGVGGGGWVALGGLLTLSLL